MQTNRKIAAAVAGTLLVAGSAYYATTFPLTAIDPPTERELPVEHDLPLAEALLSALHNPPIQLQLDNTFRPDDYGQVNLKFSGEAFNFSEEQFTVRLYGSEADLIRDRIPLLEQAVTLIHQPDGSRSFGFSALLPLTKGRYYIFCRDGSEELVGGGTFQVVV